MNQNYWEQLLGGIGGTAAGLLPTSTSAGSAANRYPTGYSTLTLSEIALARQQQWTAMYRSQQEWINAMSGLHNLVEATNRYPLVDPDMEMDVGL